MAPNLSWLSTCKSSQLKTLCTATGINSSGTKPVLTSLLQAHLPECLLKQANSRKGSQKSYNIVSIDMGIRNLAYCRLQLPSSALDTKSTNVTEFDRPIIQEWTRLSISKKTSPSPVDDGDEDESPKETFDPPTYAHHAYNLITNLLAPSPPTHILIERQRFRSMGGSSVQEWTLRVNMFESMLYAVLKTFSERGMWAGSVHPVTPAKVSNFWLRDKVEEREGKGSKSARTKTAKIGVVGDWLEEEDEGKRGLRLEGLAGEMGAAYLRKWKGVARRTRKKNTAAGLIKAAAAAAEPTEIGKLDDLADCLLQGMAWIRWEENKRLIMSKGIDSLEELR